MSTSIISTVLLISLIFEAVVAETDVSFLASICDDEQRLFCLAALIRDNWLITTNECRVTSYDLIINKLVYAGHRTVDCIHGESRKFKNIKKLGSDILGKPSTLILVELSKPFKRSSEITTIPIDASAPEDGTTCNVYYHHNLTDPFEFIQSMSLNRQFRQSPTYEIEVYSGHIIPCSFLEDSSLICMKLKTNNDYKNSPLVCNGKLIAVVVFMREGGTLAGKHLRSYADNFKRAIQNFELSFSGCSHKWRSSFDYILLITSAFLNSCYNTVH